MAKVIAYQVEVDGIQTVIANQDDLTAAVKETSKAYKSADFGSEKFKQSEKELAQLKTLQAKFRQDVRDTARDQEIAADKGKGSYRALNAELVNLRRRYKELSAEERNVVGPELLNRIQKLDTELKDIDASMGQYQRNVGNYASAFADLGGLDLAALATVPGAIVAIGTAAIDAGQYVFEITEEFRQLRGEIQNLTGATGDSLDEFTSRIASISETFEQENKEVLNAANSVAQQLGIPFEEALGKIEEGFIAGSNQTGEFLDNLREYPAFFREAGLTADQFFSVINRQATEGIYSDKGVDVIKEVTIRLREQTTATQAALEGIGLSSEQVSQQIENEGIGAAIATVSERLSQLRADSPEVGTAIADIFGGPGEDVGLAFLTSLKDINEETGSLIDVNNEYQVQQQRTLEINREFAEVQNEVAKSLGGAGAEFDNLGTIIETKALQALLFIVDRFKELLGVFSPLINAFKPLLQQLGLFNEEGGIVATVADLIAKGFRIVLIPVELAVKAISKFVDGLTDAVAAGRGFLEWIGAIDPKSKEFEKSASGMSGSMGRFGGSVKKTTEEQQKQNKEIDQSVVRLKSLKKSTDAAAVATDAFAKGSVAELRKAVSDLKKELETADPGNAPGILEKLLKAEDALDKVESFREELRNRLTSNRQAVEPLALLPTDDQVRQIASENTEVVLDEYKKRNEAIIAEEEKLSVDLKEIQQDVFSGINDVLSNLGEASQLRYENELSALEERYETEINLAGNNTRQQRRLEQELEQERRRIQERALEDQKKFRRAAALASLAEGIVNILSAPSTIPDPFGAIYKAARIAVLTVTTNQQIANINAQQVGERGLAVELARGGLLTGATHRDPSGGIPLSLNGKRVLAEHGEWMDIAEDGSIAVINKRSTAAHRAELESVRGRIFPGKRQYLSAINSHRNYGISFAAEGALLTPETASIISGQSGGSSISSGPIEISERSANLIATRTAIAVRQGAKEGVGAGMNEQTKRAQREARLSQRTGI